MNYVYSTLSNTVDYNVFADSPNDIKRVAHRITIKGGSNVADSKIVTSAGIYTPKGVVTEVNDKDLELLEQNEVFKLHKKNGFISVHKSEVSTEKGIKDLADKDRSAPITPQDYPNDPNYQGAVPAGNVKKRKGE